MADVRERLADYAHEAWSGWMRYVFKKCQIDPGIGNCTIPSDLVERWLRQMNTAYEDLPEAEKESDRKEADVMISIFRSNP